MLLLGSPIKESTSDRRPKLYDTEAMGLPSTQAVTTRVKEHAVVGGVE